MTSHIRFFTKISIIVVYERNKSKRYMMIRICYERFTVNFCTFIKLTLQLLVMHYTIFHLAKLLLFFFFLNLHSTEYHISTLCNIFHMKTPPPYGVCQQQYFHLMEYSKKKIPLNSRVFFVF